MYGYLFLAACALGLPVFVALARSDWGYRTDMDFFGCMGSLLCGFGLVLGLVFIPVSRAGVEAGIAAHYEIGRTLAEARENESSLGALELATLQREVAESNASLARAKVEYKYWRPYMPATILEVEPIK